LLNLKAFFERVGKRYQLELQQAITKQTDLAGNKFAPVTVATAKSRAYANNANRLKFKAAGLKRKLRRKISFADNAKKSQAVKPKDFKRLLFTGRFWQNAFKFESGQMDLRVYVNDSYYTLANRGLISYSDIVSFNNKNSPQLNPNIKGGDAPLIFPTSIEDVARMKATQHATREFHSPATRDEILKQITAGMEKKISVEVKL
jgi:hypothetical protein